MYVYLIVDCTPHVVYIGQSSANTSNKQCGALIRFCLAVTMYGTHEQQPKRLFIYLLQFIVNYVQWFCLWARLMAD